jgi:hypothetical protein
MKTKSRALFPIVLLISTLFFLLIGGPCRGWAADIFITWNANTEADLAGYKLYYGTHPGQYGEPVDVGKVTECGIPIKPDQAATYYFALTAYDTSGNESGYSEEATCFVPDGAPPAKPTGLKAIIRAVIAWFKGWFGLTARIV